MEKLFADLDGFGDAVAVIDEAGAAISYASLLDLAQTQAALLIGVRKLVAIEISNRLTPLATYVGAVRAGHAVILTGPGGATEDSAVVRRFDPEAVFRDADDAWTLRAGAKTAAPLHDDLAVLLSTSGSTGSPKLVRLSHANLAANARSIIEYLQIAADDAAITTLPPAYSYGLSVIHSHLLAGARLVLFDGSVADTAFAERVDRFAATSFAGVPHTYDLLDRSGFDPAVHPSLRYLTQAGGRMGADRVSAWAASAKACGRRFVVMYGQTEAAPRMAYIPPEDTERYPDCIGRAVPGGAFRIDLVGDGDEGELVYTGPNVMMGYAESRADLARGAEVTELRTGDLARRNGAGYFQITGRLNRISKVFGLRISLDEVEARLAEAGLPAAVAADDDGLVVAAPATCRIDDVERVLSGTLRLPGAAFKILSVDATPRLDSGKIDYAAILRRGREPPAEKSLAKTDIRGVLSEILGVKVVRDDDTFIGLGGDSLNYVRTWLALEDRLGHCPEGWETMTVAELEGGSHDRPQRKMAIDPDVLARAVAIGIVVMHHVTNSSVGGGATSLLVIAGMNFSRFQTPKLFNGQLWAVLEPLLVKVLLPYFVIITAYFTLQHGVFLPQYLLASNFTPTPAGGQDALRTTIFWYIETYIWVILGASLLVLTKPAQKLLTARPWTFSLGLIGVTTLVGGAARIWMKLPAFYDHTPFSMAYLFAFGWAIPQAKSLPRKLLLTALGAVALFALERPGVEFAAPVTLAALVLLLFVRKITLGWKLTQTVSTVAGASLYIYLSHGMVVHPLRTLLHGRIPPLMAIPALILCLGVGVGLARVVDFVETQAVRMMARLNLAPARLRGAELPHDEALI